MTFNSCKIKDFNACDDFAKLIVSSHIITAAMEILKMETMDDEPSNPDLIPEDN